MLHKAHQSGHPADSAAIASPLANRRLKRAFEGLQSPLAWSVQAQYCKTLVFPPVIFETQPNYYTVVSRILLYYYYKVVIQFSFATSFKSDGTFIFSLCHRLSVSYLPFYWVYLCRSLLPDLPVFMIKLIEITKFTSNGPLTSEYNNLKTNICR